MKLPFEQVVAEHGAMVLRVCRAVLDGHADADDAWTETFIAAMRAWPELPDDANVEAWLVTIAKRKAIDEIRARGRRAVALGDLPDAAPDGWMPDAAATSDAERQDVWRAVRALPERQRHAVAYRYFAGLPYREIAELMGGTADAARRAASDGIKNLRRSYRNEQEG
ncbi:RNA polymerase sigma factor [Ruicaihuangia caeni]|uniref:RNA polymerase sigma factor n=1 Tax=Ruicaihuangia caeni TaxID=3042517 RepID=UPI00338E523F